MKAMKQTVKAVACAIAVGLAFQAPATDWTFDKSTKRISRDGWTLNTSQSGSDLTVTGIVTMPTGATAIDFSGDVADADGKAYRITTINSWASSDVKANLASVILPAELTRIGDSAFSGCTALRSVSPLLSDAVTSLGTYVFQNCPIEGSLRIGFGSSMSLGTAGFGAGNQFQGVRIADVAIGPALTKITNGFLQNDTALTNVVFAGEPSVTSIGSSAFSGCTSLRKVSPLLPDTVVSLGDGAFQNCPIEGALRLGFGSSMSLGAAGFGSGNQFLGSRIADLTIGPAVTQIPGSFIAQDTALTNVLFAGEPRISSIGSSVFKGCSALRTVTPLLPDSVSSIGDSAFNGCPIRGHLRLGFVHPVGFGTAGFGSGDQFANARISEVTTGPALSSVVVSFMTGNTALTNVTFLGTNDISIGASAFSGCSALSNCVFHQYATFASDSFNNGPADLRSRFLFDKRHLGWTEYINGLGSGFRYWKGDVTTAESNAYFAAFADGLEPRGYATVSGRKKWFVPFSDGEIEEVSFHVTAEPYEVGTTEPEYGSPAPMVPPFDCSVSRYGERSGIAYESFGYRVEKMGELYWEPVSSASDSRSFVFEASEPGEYRTVWQWRQVAYRLNLAELDASLGHVDVAGTVLDAPTLEGTYYESNTVVTLTVTPAAGQTFLGWYGDIDEEPGTGSSSVHVTMDRIKSAIPYFERPWTYDASAKTITDGSWVLNVTGSTSGFTVASVGSYDPALPILDLSKEKVGFDIVAIGNNVFKGRTLLREVRLPESLTTVGSSAFSGCTSLRKVSPLLPDTVVSIGDSAFASCPIEGELRLGFGSSMSLGAAGFGAGNQFLGSRIADLTIGPAVTQFPGSFIAQDTALTNVVFVGEPRISSIGSSVFKGCSALRTVTPLLPDSVSSIGDSAFSGCPIRGHLRLGFVRSVGFGTAGFGDGNQFANAQISEVTTGPALSSVVASFMPGNTALTNVNLAASTNLASIGASAFRGATALTEVWLNSYPSFGANPFSSVPAQARFFLSREATQWDSWIANTANATAWTNLTAAAQEVYDDAWGASAKRPKARVVKAGSPFPKDSWLLRYTATTGMKLLFR